MLNRHLVITPVKDEEENIAKVMESMVEQTVPPSAWILVDDCSVDHTAEIIRDFSKKNDWITLVQLSEKGERKRGAKISKLFQTGIESSELEWDFCSKIDADIILPGNYFEAIFHEFDADPMLGIASGNCFVEDNKGRRTVEKVESSHTRGALKTYRRDCMEEFGGIREIDGWDGIDNLEAQFHGWKTRNFEHILALHLRPTGIFEGKLRRNYNDGKKSHILGYTWPYLIGKSVLRIGKWPFFLGSICILIGFINSKLSGLQTIDDIDLRKFIARKQYNRIKEIIFMKKKID